MKTAGLVVIGDEILSGKIKDENSFVFTKTMFERGVKVKRIETISDDLSDISQTVKKFSDSFDYVCTSGGVGPTHDDCTLAGIAKAFKAPLVKNQEAYDYFQKAQSLAKRGETISKAQEKMLILPHPCELFFTEPLWLPLIKHQNVFIYPGVPFLFERLMTRFSYLFIGGQFFREIIFTNETEAAIAENLEEIQEQHKNVSIGSYPQGLNAQAKVMVSVDGENQEEVSRVRDLVVSKIAGWQKA